MATCLGRLSTSECRKRCFAQRGCVCWQQRWFDNEESMDWTLPMDSSPTLDDEPVIDVLNKRAPVAWNKWRRASVRLRAGQKSSEALEQRQQKLEERMEELADEILRDYHSFPEPLTGYAPSVEELSSMLKVPLVQRNSKNGKSPPAFDWDRVLKLLDRKEKRPAWSVVAADLNNTINKKINELGEPMALNPEKMQAILETAEEISKTLHASIVGLTTALEKLKVIANCVTELTKSRSPPETVDTRKKLFHHFQGSYAHLKNLVRERDKIAEGLNNLVKDLASPELSVSSRVQSCSRSISKLVSSTLERQSSEYISLATFVDVYFGDENDPS